MRVLITIAGAYAYVQPMLPLAIALRDAGHEVRVACQPRMVPLVHAAGIDAVGTFEDGSATPTPEYVREKAPQWVRSLLAVAEEWPPDVVVREWTELGGLVVAVERGLPCVVCGIKMRPAPQQTFSHPCLALIDEAMNGVQGSTGGDFGLDVPRLMSRQARTPRPAGQAPKVDLTMLFGDLWLSFYPPSFAWPGTPALAGEVNFQPPQYDRIDGWEPPEWLSTLDDRPLVYATLGTSYNQSSGVLEGTVAVLAGLPVQLVVTMGLDRDPAELGTLPDNVHVERYFPNSLIMPRATAAVIHGGSNTVLAALSHGVPFVCVPVGGLQPLNAQRSVDLGVALSYQDGDEGLGLRPPDVHATRIRELTVRVLEEPEFGEAARRLAAEIRTLPSIDEAVPMIESLSVPERV